jgi:hypothetical protein
MRTSRIALGVLAGCLLTGCGAILHGTRQTIDVQSSPGGAKIETSPATGTYTTPTTLDLERKNSYVLTFTSPGYSSASFNLHNSIGTGTVIADVLLTGLVGVVVDGLTGAWYGLSPESANVTLTRTGTGPGPEEIHVRIDRSPDGRGLAVTSDAAAVKVKVSPK